MVGSRKESRLWACLNLITDVFKAVECCQVFGLSKDEEVKVISLWEAKRRRFHVLNTQLHRTAKN